MSVCRLAHRCGAFYDKRPNPFFLRMRASLEVQNRQKESSRDSTRLPLPRESTCAWTARCALTLSTRAEISRSADFDITGVPAFVLNERHMIRGAQDPDTFVRILERIATR